MEWPKYLAYPEVHQHGRHRNVDVRCPRNQSGKTQTRRRFVLSRRTRSRYKCRGRRRFHGKVPCGPRGYPNAKGVHEFDAAVMVGEGCRFGGVAGLRGVATPVSVARRVMETSSHSMLVGPGATAFAVEQGFPLETSDTLHTEVIERISEVSQTASRGSES
ncbi:hypothetical protein Bbelb_043490 [Branchiostoma belcheri]|nr:hypothetical protein Bbelb_043490 [Branchiostoma belcheri]